MLTHAISGSVRVFSHVMHITLRDEPMLQYFLQLNCFWKQRWMHTLTLRVNGVILETEFSFSSHGIKPAYYHLKNIAVISGLVSRQDLEKRVHAFISSRVGYCNGLLPKKRISSCRTLWTRTHLTPVLRSSYTIVMHIFKHRINEWLKRQIPNFGGFWLMRIRNAFCK